LPRLKGNLAGFIAGAIEINQRITVQQELFFIAVRELDKVVILRRSVVFIAGIDGGDSEWGRLRIRVVSRQKSDCKYSKNDCYYFSHAGILQIIQKIDKRKCNICVSVIHLNHERFTLYRYDYPCGYCSGFPAT
jgi:hypothetical protein